MVADTNHHKLWVLFLYPFQHTVDVNHLDGPCVFYGLFSSERGRIRYMNIKALLFSLTKDL